MNIRYIIIIFFKTIYKLVVVWAAYDYFVYKIKREEENSFAVLLTNPEITFIVLKTKVETLLDSLIYIY